MIAAGTEVAAQTAVMEKGKAVVCTGSSTKCPNGHDTCRVIDMPIVVGNDNASYPDWGQLINKRVLECEQCHVLFIAS